MGLSVLLGCAASNASAETLWLPSIFSEGMVLQRDMPVPVWGRAAPGAEVSVTLYDGGKVLAEGTAEADAETGRWRVTLDPIPAGGRYSMLVVAKDESNKPDGDMRLFSNVLAGEVWLICGQSNMLHPMNACAEREDAIEHRNDYPLIRVALVGRRNSHHIQEPREEPLCYWGPVKWENASYTVPRSSSSDIPGSSSGVSYFFARALARWFAGKIPIGMIEVGQILPVEAWVDDAVIADTPELAHLRGKNWPNATSRAFNADIHPLTPYALRGAIYYQGEMNSGRPFEYYHGLKAMIKSWRHAFEQPAMPFLIVQLPGFIKSMAEKTALDMSEEQLAQFDGQNRNHGFCGIREAQLRVSREDPNTGLAVIIDKGDKFDIHPSQKLPVGERLALQARKLVYNDKDVVADGPLAREFRRKGDRFVVTFDGTGGGLRAENELTDFEILGPDGVWHPAVAEIKGKTVEVRADKVSKPEGVRYAWSGYPESLFFNAEGLPASPFHYPPVEFEQPAK